MIMKKKVVVFTGAGMSADSGIATFRDSDGLWAQHRIEDVCTPEALIHNRKEVIDFYNTRRKELLQTQPNKGHWAVKQLEDYFSVEVITQNIDDLHERAGSTHITHLHGELRKLRSSKNENLTYPIEGWEQKMDDRSPDDGSLLRPFVVFFGEQVPNLEIAQKIAATAEIFIVIGTSLAVYPAAMLIHYINPHIPVYIVDPKQPPVTGVRNPITHIAMGAAQGVPLLVKQLTGQM